MEIIVFTDGQGKTFASDNASDLDEDETLSNLLDDFEKEFNLEYLRSKVIHGFHQLRENHSSGDGTKLMLIPVEAGEVLERHISCKNKNNEDSTNHETCEN